MAVDRRISFSRIGLCTGSQRRQLTPWRRRFYEGSLTTPTLAQPVNWVVLSTPITLDSAQLKQYEAVAKGEGFLPNARPTQPLDGRQVNEFNFDVNFQSQSVAALNFTLSRKS